MQWTEEKLFLHLQAFHSLHFWRVCNLEGSFIQVQPENLCSDCAREWERSEK